MFRDVGLNRLLDALMLIIKKMKQPETNSKRYSVQYLYIYTVTEEPWAHTKEPLSSHRPSFFKGLGPVATNSFSLSVFFPIIPLS